MLRYDQLYCIKRYRDYIWKANTWLHHTKALKIVLMASSLGAQYYADRSSVFKRLSSVFLCISASHQHILKKQIALSKKNMISHRGSSVSINNSDEKNVCNSNKKTIIGTKMITHYALY